MDGIAELPTGLGIAELLTGLSFALVVLGVVNTQGRVTPSSPGGFGTPLGTDGVDANTDFQPDYIDTQGNEVFFNDADPNDPSGGSTGVGGYAWDDASIWVDYDSRWSVVIGNGGYGIVEVNGGSALRPGGLTMGVGGFGLLTVTGVGSVFNLDPELIPDDLRAALAFAADARGGSGVGFTPNAITYADIPDPGQSPAVDEANLAGSVTGPSRRRTGTTVDDIPAVIGSTHAAHLQIEAGARFEVGDFLTVDKGSLVSLNGANSHLSIRHSADTTRSEVKAGSLIRLSVGASMSVATQPLKLTGRLDVGLPGTPGEQILNGDVELNKSGGDAAGIRVRCGNALTITGAVTGSGVIYLDQGASLNIIGAKASGVDVRSARALPAALFDDSPDAVDQVLTVGD